MYFCIQQQQKEMGNFLTNISRSFKGHKNVVIIILVALVVELISATQYYEERTQFYHPPLPFHDHVGNHERLLLV